MIKRKLIKNIEKQIKNILENKKKYYQTNKEKINKKYACECGGSYPLSLINKKQRHLRTIKHTAWFMEQVD